MTEGNAMFIHILVWDKRYTGNFFADLLTGLFDITSCLQHVILVVPPQIIIRESKDGSFGRRGSKPPVVLIFQLLQTCSNGR